jgi:hypothetical protein
MKIRSLWMRRLGAAALVYALAMPPAASAQSEQQEKKPGRKGAIAVLVSGLALVAVGAVAITQSSNGCHGQWVTDGSGWGSPCIPIPWLQQDTRKMGLIAIGVGSAAAVGGIVMLSKSRRPQTDSPNSNGRPPQLGSRAVALWLYAHPRTPGRLDYKQPAGPSSDCMLLPTACR